MACSNFPECRYVQKKEAVVEETCELCPQCGSKMVYKTGRYGRFEACSNYPECKYIKKKTKSNSKSNSAKEVEYVEGMVCPNCGGRIVMKQGRYGAFKACENYPKCKTIIK